MSFTSLVATPQNAGQDRRSAGRRRPDQLIYVNLGAHNGGIVVDLGEGGLQFQSVERIMLGDSLPVTFMLTGTVAAIKATAAVVWCNDSGKGGGLKLLDLPKITQHEISAWVSRGAPQTTSAEAPPAKGSGRAAFNLLTTEGRVAPPEPVSDEAAMNMARLLVSARGYARPDSEPQPPFRVHDQIQGAASSQVANEVHEEIHEEVHNEVHEEVHDEVREPHNEFHEEVAPEITTPAAAETEAQSEIPVVADAVAEAIPEAVTEAAPEVVSEPIVPFAELASYVELAEEHTGSAEHAVEATAEAHSEPIAAMESPVESLAAEAIAEAVPKPAAPPEAAAAEIASDEVTFAEVSAAEVAAADVTTVEATAAEIPKDAASEVTGTALGASSDEAANETVDQTPIEGPAGAAVAETPAETSAETLPETPSDALETTLVEDAAQIAAAETTAAHAEAAPNADANLDENVPASSDADILAPLPESAANATANQSADIHADIDAPPSPAPLAAALLAENIAAPIAPAVLYEIVAEVVAGLESKSKPAPEIAPPLDPEESAKPLADVAANSLETIAPASQISSSQTEAPATHEGAPPVAFTGGSLPYDIAPMTETAPPAEVTPAESAPISAAAALHANSEARTAAQAAIVSYAKADAAPIATPPAPIPAAARTVAEGPKAASTQPSSIARKATDARVPAPDVSRKSAKGHKSKRAEKREKAIRTIHDSMQSLSLLQKPNPAATTGAIPSVVPSETRGMHTPGWGAQVVKFAIGVGVGCCLVAGAFVGIILLGPGHGARIFAGANADNAPETSAAAVAPALDVEVIDLNSRRWHLNDSTPDAVFFASQEPVVELTPAEPQPAAGASATASALAVPVAKLPVASPLAAKPPVAKLSAAESPAAKSPAKSPAKSLVAKSPAPKLVVPQAPNVPVVAPKPAVEPSAPPTSLAAQAAPLVDSPAKPDSPKKSDSPKNLALPNPVATRGAGNSTDVGAPSITESISTSISYPIGNSVGTRSAPVDPRTPVSSNTVFPPALLLPPVRHNADFHVASPIRQDNPTYPAEAKRLQVTGTVRMDAFVGKDGKAHSLKVISGDPRLSSASLAAVSNWTFRPAQLDGEAVESEVTISVKFDLH